MMNGQNRLGDLLADFVKASRLELDVISLPGKRGIAHVEERSFLAINSAALIDLAVQAKGIQHLDFITRP